MPLYAIFRDKQKAEAFQSKLHNHLTKTRERYNATKWSDTDENKHPKKDEWKVILHPEQIDLSGEDCTVVEELDADWATTEPINGKGETK